MGVGERRQKDQAMAQRMKDDEVERTVGRCPICYRLIQLPKLEAHIGLNCTGPERPLPVRAARMTGRS